MAKVLRQLGPVVGRDVSTGQPSPAVLESQAVIMRNYGFMLLHLRLCYTGIEN